MKNLNGWKPWARDAKKSVFKYLLGTRVPPVQGGQVAVATALFLKSGRRKLLGAVEFRWP